MAVLRGAVIVIALCVLSACPQPDWGSASAPEDPWKNWPEGGWFIAPGGNDDNSGSIDAPFATLARAQRAAQPGDTVYIRGGVYHIGEDQISGSYSGGVYAAVFSMDKSGETARRINYWGYRDERPVFDFSAVKPPGRRVAAFLVSGSWLHFKNFEVVGVQVTQTGHTQSECFRVVNNASNNIFEHLAMHDGMGIGYYLERGSNNLVLNCDAYNNYDPVGEGGRGENNDGFGAHPDQAENTGNVFRGCRAWYNADDGFDLIHSKAAVTIENCWAYKNGYQLKEDGSLQSRGNGAGFKAGGYGMDGTLDVSKYPQAGSVPRHTVRFSLAVRNKNSGFYANHHLGGLVFHNNTAFRNRTNFDLVNRKSIVETVDVPGYGHDLKNNASFMPVNGNADIRNIDAAACALSHNTFDEAMGITLADRDFVASSEADEASLLGPRKPDGSLPDTGFMRPSPASQLADRGIPLGFPYYGSAPDIGYAERR
jgi:hypothetical protein